jgi:hypothetical protein
MEEDHTHMFAVVESTPSPIPLTFNGHKACQRKKIEQEDGRCRMEPLPTTAKSVIFFFPSSMVHMRGGIYSFYADVFNLKSFDPSLGSGCPPSIKSNVSSMYCTQHRSLTTIGQKTFFHLYNIFTI